MLGVSKEVFKTELVIRVLHNGKIKYSLGWNNSIIYETFA